MRRALSSSSSGRHSLPQSRTARQSSAQRADYVVNWPAIFASLTVLSVLVGAPAGIYALWPSLLGFSHGPAERLDPLVVTVDPAVSRTPPHSQYPGPADAQKSKEAGDFEAETVDRNDTTRRILRSRRSSPPPKRLVRDADQHDGDGESHSRGFRQTVAIPAPPMDGRHLPQDELLKQLRLYVPELRIDDTGEFSTKLIKAAVAARDGAATNEKNPKPKDGLPDSSLLRNAIAQREDFAGLPFRWDGTCKAEKKKLGALTQVSAELRSLAAQSARFSSIGSFSSEASRLTHILDKLDSKAWNTPEHVPALEQTLQADSVSLALVDGFSRIQGAEATQALARRALYGLSPEVRTAAVNALKRRKAADYERVLADGLRYPWAPVAVNAADALVELETKGVVPELVAMLELPAPGAPQRNEEGKWTVRELVKLNHLRNCTLCHAPTVPRTDLLTGFVPKLGQPLPVAYYDSSSGGFVRADITYLRQDFSVMLEADDEGPWPFVQRFDFMVRTRVLPPEEQARLNESPPDAGGSSQRDAVLYALRHLTGRDAGDDAQAWRDALAASGGP